MGKAVKHLWNLSEDELMREHLEAVEKQRRDRKAQMDYQREEGKEEGRKEGRAEGRTEGREEKEKEIVVKMLKNNISLKEISIYTGLSLSEIKKLEQ